MTKSKEEVNAYHRAYRARRKEEGVAVHDGRPRRNLKRTRCLKYGITEADYEAMWARQDGLCALCFVMLKENNLSSDDGETAHIDHCHTTGKVRGILCPCCNTGLGQLKDNTQVLARAIAYLGG